jgi:Mg-chelatase subunit ChlI
MNPEEESLRPQLPDRFALVVDVVITSDAARRREVVERRLSMRTTSPSKHFRPVTILPRFWQTARNRPALAVCNLTALSHLPYNTRDLVLHGNPV